MTIAKGSDSDLANAKSSPVRDRPPHPALAALPNVTSEAMKGYECARVASQSPTNGFRQ